MRHSAEDVMVEAIIASGGPASLRGRVSARMFDLLMRGRAGARRRRAVRAARLLAGAARPLRGAGRAHRQSDRRVVMPETWFGSGFMRCCETAQHKNRGRRQHNDFHCRAPVAATMPEGRGV